MDPRLFQYVIPAIVIVVVLAVRMRSMNKQRPLNPRRLLIFPILLVGIALITIGLHPPGLIGLGLCLLGFVVGGLIGWQRGRMMRIERDPVTGGLVQRASPAAMLLLVAIIIVRFVARAYFVGTPGPDTPGGMDAHALLITDVMLTFAVGLLGMTRIEMFLRARHILGAPLQSSPRRPE